MNAADLPDGSVVADNRKAFIKNHPTKTAQWRGTDGGYHGDWSVDEALTGGAEVLRHGTGDTTAPAGVCQCSSFPMARGAGDCPNHVPGAAPII